MLIIELQIAGGENYNYNITVPEKHYMINCYGCSITTTLVDILILLMIDTQCEAGVVASFPVSLSSF